MCIRDSAISSILLKERDYRNAFNAMFGQSRNYYAGQLRIPTILYRNIRRAYTPMILRNLKSKWKRSADIKPPDESLINEEFAKRVHLTDRLARMHAYDENGLGQSTHELHAENILKTNVTAGIER